MIKFDVSCTLAYYLRVTLYKCMYVCFTPSSNWQNWSDDLHFHLWMFFFKISNTCKLRLAFAIVRYHVQLMPIHHIGQHMHLYGVRCKCLTLPVRVFFSLDDDILCTQSSLLLPVCLVHVCVCACLWKPVAFRYRVKLEVGFKIEGAAQNRSKNALH